MPNVNTALIFLINIVLAFFKNLFNILNIIPIQIGININSNIKNIIFTLD